MMNLKTSFIFLSLLFVFMKSAQAELDRDGVLRNEDGSVRYMSQYDAINACPTGTHLPTARELALESHKRGSKGILEVNQVDPGPIPEGYYLITAINPSNGKDEFYFNYDGYLASVDDLGKNVFWSSSLSPYDSIYALELDGYNGAVVGSDYRERTDVAVLCLRNF